MLRGSYRPFKSYMLLKFSNSHNVVKIHVHRRNIRLTLILTLIVGPDSVLLNYIYFRCTNCNVHFLDIICERINFALNTLKYYLIRILISSSSTPNQSFGALLINIPKYTNDNVCQLSQIVFIKCPLVPE